MCNVTVSEFMRKKQHVSLSNSFETNFPDLFNFESAQLLFLDKNDGCLFKITDPLAGDSCHDDSAPERTEPVTKKPKPVMMRLPKDRGITGLSIETRKCQKSDEGQYGSKFAPEVDNCTGIQVVNNCMIGPCFDSEGSLQGII